VYQGWQDLMALGIVFSAVGYLARLSWNALTRKGKGGCGTGCGNCSTRVEAASGPGRPVPDQVVSIGSIRHD
jgi:FeoB-associated Cys-rich membrane protein